MKRLFLLLILSLIPLTVRAQAGLFTLYGDQPIVAHGPANEWDGQYTDPGAVFYYDGQFNLFRNGFRGWPAPVGIGYLTSPDGLHWTEVTPEPVMTTTDVPYAKVAALASDGMVLDDGTWVLYFYTWNSYSQTNAPGAIGRATAPAPTGPWTPDPEPVLNPGSAGSWDDLMVNAPRIVKTEDGYRMYYTGLDSTDGLASSRIGMATSTDGIHWSKYDDPTTTEAPFAESDPIMTPPPGISFIQQPMVEITPDGWVMTFRQVDASSLPVQMSLNYALSDDGIHWNIPSSQPFWGRNTVPGSNGFFYTAMEYHDGTYFQYVETAIRGGTDIYVATHEGSLKPAGN